MPLPTLLPSSAWSPGAFSTRQPEGTGSQQAHPAPGVCETNPTSPQGPVWPGRPPHLTAPSTCLHPHLAWPPGWLRDQDRMGLSQAPPQTPGPAPGPPGPPPPRWKSPPALVLLASEPPSPGPQAVLCWWCCSLILPGYQPQGQQAQIDLRQRVPAGHIRAKQELEIDQAHVSWQIKDSRCLPLSVSFTFSSLHFHVSPAFCVLSFVFFVR